MPKKVTQKDLARLANVSEATVSLVLRDAPSRISQEKKEEIKELAHRLNYRPNRVAQSLSTNKTHTIGLIVPDIENPYFSSLVKYIEEGLYEKGYLLFIISNNNSLANDIHLLQELMARQIDGILLIASTESYQSSDKITYFIDQLDTPLVLVDRIFDQYITNQVAYDNRHGGLIATQHLIEEGCQRIACITGPLASYSGSERLAGYREALEINGFAVNPVLIYEGNYYFNSGYQQGLKIVQDGHIDGVFVGNDLMAYGLLSAMRQTHFDSSKIKLVGYDNLRQSEMFGFSLVSVEQSVKTLAHNACKQILRQISKPDYSKQTILKPKLITHS